MFIRDNKLFNNFDFKLFEDNESGNIIEFQYSGAWLIVDNGYLYWSCTVSLLKKSSSYKFTQFSKWLESTRKDVEFIFGILKGTFSILITGIRICDIENVDQIWLTCCALHNMPLFVDGLH